MKYTETVNPETGHLRIDIDLGYRETLKLWWWIIRPRKWTEAWYLLIYPLFVGQATAATVCRR